MRDLTARDFEVLDGGQVKPISDFRRDQSGVSIALLFDVSGSMEALLTPARESAMHVISWLDARDEAAVFAFDSALEEVAPFTKGMLVLPPRMSSIIAVRRHLAPRRHRADGRTPGGPGEQPPRGGRASPTAATHGAALTPSEVSAHRERDRRAGLHPRHRARGGQPVRRHRYGYCRAISIVRLAGRIWRTGPAARRSSSAVQRREASWHGRLWMN